MAALAGAAPASLAHDTDPAGHTTVEQTVAAGGVRDAARPGFVNLAKGTGAPYVERRLGTAVADPGRTQRRRSIVYFGQLTDFQLADEESPARVEFVDRGPSSAFRPHEALQPHAIDLSLQQMNRYTGASPVRQGDGSRARMSFALLTGDQSDNQQRNETIWVRQLVEGGQTLDPNSGRRVNDFAECGPVVQQALLAKNPPAEPAYTGVQDYGDYFEARDFYDPNRPVGQWASWPLYQGLMDRAQRPFAPAGLDVPTYVTNGNHDGLVQGNEDANREFERIATGCVKPVTTTSNAPLGTEPNPNFLLSPGVAMFVPPDNPGRSFVDRVEVKKIYLGGRQRDGHGYAFIDKAEAAASAQAATYYAWDARPGLRFISIDTVAEGGLTAEDPSGAVPVTGSSNGNIDDPQWQWLRRELKAASDADKLIVVFGHHPVRSLSTRVVDEQASPCTGRYDAALNYQGQRDEHGHDPNPGCDLDPRVSSPVHTGEELAALLEEFPHAIAYVAGHTHENKILPFARRDGRGFWELNTSATADWPQQHRLVEVFDNRDGTLSVFGTVLDHAGPLPIPPDTRDAGAVGAFSTQTLGALARSFAFNDPQSDKAAPPGKPDGAEGAPEDGNVELLLADPRRNANRPGGAGACAQTAGFRSATARGRGRGLALRFARRARRPARIDVFQQSRGRRIFANRRVARFTNRLASFRWNGRATRGGRKPTDGFYVVRFRVRADNGRLDQRRIALVRRRGRFRAAPAYYRRASCGLLSSYKLTRPVFGGRAGRDQGIAFRVSRAARVSVTVSRAGRTVRRFRTARRRARRTHRLRLPARGLPRGAYRFRITVRAPGRSVAATLTARRLQAIP